MVYKYNFQERLNKLLVIDKIRFFKILEMIQYTSLYYILIIITVYLLNKIYYRFFDVDKIVKENDKNITMEKSDKNKKNFYLLFFSILLDTIIIILLFFYFRKIILLFPSLPHLLDKKFIPNTTFEFINKIALVYLTMALLPTYNDRLTKLQKILSGK